MPKQLNKSAGAQRIVAQDHSAPQDETRNTLRSECMRYFCGYAFVTTSIFFEMQKLVAN